MNIEQLPTSSDGIAEKLLDHNYYFAGPSLTEPVDDRPYINNSLQRFWGSDKTIDSLVGEPPPLSGLIKHFDRYETVVGKISDFLRQIRIHETTNNPVLSELFEDSPHLFPKTAHASIERDDESPLDIAFWESGKFRIRNRASTPGKVQSIDNIRPDGHQTRASTPLAHIYGKPHAVLAMPRPISKRYVEFVCEALNSSTDSLYQNYRGRLCELASDL